jgi:hypothetical protein
MGRAIAQFMRLFEASGATVERWQSTWDRSVQWESQVWEYQPFISDGFTDGLTGSETSLNVNAPATTRIAAAFEEAILRGRFAEVRLYQYDTSAGNNEPQAGQVLIGQFTGQVVGGGCRLTNIQINLGSALSPVGAQFPPRKLTTGIMGKGCRL